MSSARCTPNDAPSFSGVLDREMRASRGAVRMPFPIRSTNSAAVVGATVVDASNPIFVAADRA
jgi:hypothetical protein